MDKKEDDISLENYKGNGNKNEHLKDEVLKNETGNKENSKVDLTPEKIKELNENSKASLEPKGIFSFAIN